MENKKISVLDFSFAAGGFEFRTFSWVDAQLWKDVLQSMFFTKRRRISLWHEISEILILKTPQDVKTEAAWFCVVTEY